MFFWLIVGHCVADYPLQGEFLARGKNAYAPIPGVPWWIPMAAHSLIHAGAVALITGSVALGVAEFALHWFIDANKCADNFGRWGASTAFTIDQALHVACKLLWVVL